MKNLQDCHEKNRKSLAVMTGLATCGDLANWYLDGFKSDIRRGWGRAAMDWGDFLNEWIDEGG